MSTKYDEDNDNSDITIVVVIIIKIRSNTYLIKIYNSTNFKA